MSTASRSRAIRLLILLAAAWAVQGQAAAQEQGTPRRLLMWKATSPTTTVYLLGSIHVGDKGLYPLPAEAESAFAAARVLVVEVNVKLVDAAKALGLMQKYGMYSGDDSLSKHLTKETSDALDAHCQKNGLLRAELEKLKPWCVGVMLAAISLKQAGEDPNLGIDLHFLNQVKEPQRIEELETADFQMSVLASATEQEQQDMLAATLKSIDKAKDFLLKMQEAYSAGDGDALLKLIEEEDNGPKSLIKRLVDDRNVSMGARIDEYLKGNESCFVVVGAAHLIGDKGIVKLLQDKGYRVERVDPARPPRAGVWPD
jgi:uncharacterized protein YbaP (TraB family)